MQNCKCGAYTGSFYGNYCFYCGDGPLRPEESKVNLQDPDMTIGQALMARAELDINTRLSLGYQCYMMGVGEHPKLGEDFYGTDAEFAVAMFWGDRFYPIEDEI